MISAEADAEFVPAMDEVLDTYERPYDPAQPGVCMDEQPVRLVKETREPLAARAEHARRVAYEYVRAGTAAVFMFCERLGGRKATARERRTKVDWAHEVAAVLEGCYADRERITLVLDNLNAHTKGSFYTAFGASRACELVRRTDFC